MQLENCEIKPKTLNSHLQMKVPESAEEWKCRESELLELQWNVSTVCDGLRGQVVCWC